MDLTEFIKQAASKKKEEKPDINEYIKDYYINKGASDYYAELEKMEKEAAVNPRDIATARSSAGDATSKIIRALTVAPKGIERTLGRWGAGLSGKGVREAWRGTAKKSVPRSRALGIFKRKPEEVDRSLYEHVKQFARQKPVQRAAVSYAAPGAGLAAVHGHGRREGELATLRKR